MLKQTFLHVPGVGYKTEQDIWSKNIFSWDQFLESKKRESIRRFEVIEDYLIKSKKALKKKDVKFFLKSLPKSEYWRLYPNFKDSTLFLDIETTGLSPYYNDITVATTFNGEKWKLFMNKVNLKKLQKELSRYSVIVTFNGTLFDLPFIRSKMPGVVFPSAHLDLRWILRKLGYEGGLKEIEKQFSVKRGKKIEDLDGAHAAILWNRFLRKDHKSLETLIKYNVADVVGLKPLMDEAYLQLSKQYLKKSIKFKKITKVHCAKTKVNYWGGRYTIKFGKNQRYSISEDNLNAGRMKINSLLGLIRIKNPTIVGVDLKGYDRSNSGIATLKDRTAITELIKTDKEIINWILKTNPNIVSIDSPLGVPHRRHCMGDECTCRRFGITRECERILFSRRVPVFPCLLPSMKPLTRRGMRLAEKIRKLGFKVIESYPGAAQDILHITRKKVDVEELKDGLIYFGLRGPFIDKKTNHDELDAITSALVGYFFLAKKYEALGNKEEEFLIVPKLH